MAKNLIVIICTLATVLPQRASACFCTTGTRCPPLGINALEVLNQKDFMQEGWIAFIIVQLEGPIGAFLMFAFCFAPYILSIFYGSQSLRRFAAKTMLLAAVFWIFLLFAAFWSAVTRFAPHLLLWSAIILSLLYVMLAIIQACWLVRSSRRYGLLALLSLAMSLVVFVARSLTSCSCC